MPTSFLAVSGSAVRPDWGGGIIRWHVIGGGGVGWGGGGRGKLGCDLAQIGVDCLAYT